MFNKNNKRINKYYKRLLKIKFKYNINLYILIYIYIIFNNFLFF